VLQGSGLGDAAVVVTRYFGGTKLGTGGLVRAYSEAVRQVLAITPRAYKIPVHTLMLGLPYSLFVPVRLLITTQGGSWTGLRRASPTMRFPVEILMLWAALSDLRMSTAGRDYLAKCW
jgi:putative IMPACT (imprinted ancient) family translation regulator